jgi:peptidoglycan-N-acetylglucosamine deacetylase
MTGAEIVEMTTKLLATLTAQKVPAVGFVNESKLYYDLNDVQPRIHALSLWTDGGFELGNHTFSHMSLNNNPLTAWEEDVVRGETVTRMLDAQHKIKLRYFRHPFLDTGLDLETRRQAEMFLAQRGYRIAPVTMDAWDWMFAGPYTYARKNNDAALQQRVLNESLSYTTTVFDYYEKLSRDLFGYEPRQILLLHGNWLEADHIGDLLDLLRKRGYQFVTLQQALADQAYALPNTYVGPEGMGWIDQWAISMGKPPQHTPVFPQWVIDKAHEISAPREPVTPPSNPTAKP